MDQTALNQTNKPGGIREKILGIDPGQLPLLKGLTEERRYEVLILATIVTALLSVMFAVLYVHKINNQAGLVEVATTLETQSQRYSKNAQQAVAGDEGAFALLKSSEASFASGLQTLVEGGGGLPAAPGSAQSELGDVRKAWDESRNQIDTLLGRQDALLALKKSVDQINDSQDTLYKIAAQAGGKLDVLTQRIVKNANQLVASNTLPPDDVYQMSQDVATFDGAVQASGNQPLREAYEKFGGPAHEILKSLPRLVEAKHAANDLFGQSERMLNLTEQLTNKLKAGTPRLFLALSFILGLIAALSLFMLVLSNVTEARRRAEGAAREQESAARENRRNQEAILRLLNEMGDLAEGNLTVRATVTEDITGAIADSVNFAIEELRTLVGNVSRAVVQVTQATDGAKVMAQSMLGAAEQQTKDIGQTTDSVKFMSDSINQVSQNAAESAEVAQKSLDFARKGGDSVRDAIAGMNTIRDQIQETSKRIKRLGESSQEIGEIVELISDITEQTNVLALNAAIQAAAAGEAGRGFSVVAEEVQRLAERSGQATRRIGAIVKTIQTDTQDTINAMESSTQGVVEGAVLSDTAGHVLQDIESVSEELAQLIQRISDATREQAETAARISENMQQILRQTQQSSSSAQQSADSIGQLTQLADELRISVAGFTL